MNIQRRQQGFGLIEIILLIVMVGVVGFVSWYVWNANQSASQSFSSANSASNAQPEPSKTRDPYKDWKTYSSSNSLGLSFRYPSSWSISENNPNQMCAGESTTSVTPEASEVEAAFKQMGASYTAPRKLDGVNLGTYYHLRTQQHQTLMQ